MPLIHIKSGNLPKEQKKRIGDRIIEAFHQEGIPASSVVILFARQDSDILLDGGLLFEAEAAPQVLPEVLPSEPPVVTHVPAPEIDEDFKNKLRRSKRELTALKDKLIKTLETQGALSSFQAQEELGLKACDWAPATLRRFFSELEDEGVILKQGQKRGTRYVWKGTASQSSTLPAAARLVKRSDDDPSERS